MAFYPIEDYKVISAKTQPELDALLREAINEGYEPVGDILFNSTEEDDRLAYSQSLIKRTNTDSQYIAEEVAAFQPKFDAINTALASINTKLQTIAENTAK